MPLYIRDDDVHALASRLAERRGYTLTEAVRSALSEALARAEAERAEKLRRTREILAELDAMPDLRPGFTHDDLYDEDGMPVL
jgi:hypothetical protein